MTDLCILRRAEETELLKATRADDAFALAAQLAEGHPFEMHVVAIYPCSGHLLENMSLPGHVKSGWYRTGPASLITTVAAHVAASLESAQDERLYTESDTLKQDAAAESDTLKQDAAAESDDSTATENGDEEDTLLTELFASVQVCSKTEADKATTIKKALVKKHGKAQATLLLAPLKEAVLKGAGYSKQRLYVYQGQPLRLK